MAIKCCTNKKTANNLHQTVDFLRIIAEENRIRILCMLKNGPKCVCEIWPALDLTQNLTSHHLGVFTGSWIGKVKEART